MLEEVFRWQEGTILSTLSADLDGDGEHELLVGAGPYTRRVRELVTGPNGAWSVRKSSAATISARGRSVRHKIPWPGRVSHRTAGQPTPYTARGRFGPLAPIAFPLSCARTIEDGVQHLLAGNTDRQRRNGRRLQGASRYRSRRPSRVRRYGIGVGLQERELDASGLDACATRGLQRRRRCGLRGRDQVRRLSSTTRPAATASTSRPPGPPTSRPSWRPRAERHSARASPQRNVRTPRARRGAA